MAVPAAEDADDNKLSSLDVRQVVVDGLAAGTQAPPRRLEKRPPRWLLGAGEGVRQRRREPLDRILFPDCREDEIMSVAYAVVAK